MSHAADAKHHREEAAQMRAKAFSMLLKAVFLPKPVSPSFVEELKETVVAELEHLEAAAVASILHRLEKHLETMTVEGPARAAVEQLVRGG